MLDSGYPMTDDTQNKAGAPVGRRVILGVLALGGLGVIGGSRIQHRLAKILEPVEAHDPTGLVANFPLGDTFRYYSVTGSVPHRSAATYRLALSGLVSTPANYTMADLQAMPQTSFVKTFHCVTGWRVIDVHWSGVRLSHLLDVAGPTPAAAAVRFRSFDGVYTESMTMAEARGSDVIVALTMLGQPISHDHGGPVRTYAGSMYGYKSTKWLSAIEIVDVQEPGFWETRGYDIDGTVRNA